MRHATQFALTIAVLALAQISPGPLSAQNEHAAPIIKPNDGETGSVEEPNLKPRTTFRDCEGCPIMVVVAPGTFEMGSPADEKGHRPSEAPQTGITFKKPLAIGQFEITVYQFGEFLRDTGYTMRKTCSVLPETAASEDGVRKQGGVSWENPGFDQSGTQPVVCVTWNDAQAYIKWLSVKTGFAYRLLSEAEWEYAARAGSKGAYHSGDSVQDICSFANVADSSAPFPWKTQLCRDYVAAQTSEAGRFGANSFRVHDMMGNASEWVADCWSPTHEAASTTGEAREPAECSKRTIRGGSWTDRLALQRAAVRRGAPGEDHAENRLGFRVARPLGAPDEQPPTK